MALVTTDLVTDFGAYINNGQNAEKIRNAFIHPESSLLKVFRTIPTQNELERSSLTTHTRVAQAFKRKWSPTGDITFTPHEIPLFKHKLDVEFYPDDVEKTWLAFLAGEGINRTEWPFVRWYAEKHLLTQYDADIEMNERVKGIYAAPTDNTTAAAISTAMNGIDRIIGTHVADSLITPYASGALSATAATFVGQVEGFVKSIDQKERKFVKYVNLPLETKDRWLAGMRSLYLGNWAAVTETEKMKVIDQDVMVNFVEAQDGGNLMWATMEGNAVRYVKREKNRKALEIDNDMRLVKVTTDHWEGLGFNVPQFVYVNNQTTVIP